MENAVFWKLLRRFQSLGAAVFRKPEFVNKLLT